MLSKAHPELSGSMDKVILPGPSAKSAVGPCLILNTNRHRIRVRVARVQQFHSPPIAQARNPVIVVDVYKVGSSCGYAVPFFDFKSHRTRLLAWAAKKEEKDIAAAGDSEDHVSGFVDGLKRCWNTKNTKSLDGLTGLTFAPYTSDTFPAKDINYKPDNEATKSRYRFLTMNSAGGMNLVVGFSLGDLAASVYMSR
ncbi:hypothetical protein C8J57DRAFT_1470170 [Mycena rebaudengoi]|nr:hypothetical protein C8J57DRAFT_1470170 [Mycena rebaudengoi]